MIKKIILNFLLLSFSVSAKEFISVAISAAPNNLNPFYSTDANSQNIDRLIHLSLIDFNEKMQFECRACSRFSESMEGSKHVFIFELRSGLMFSDGTSVSANDVEKSWKYFSKDEEIKSTFKGAFESIENVEVLSPLKVKIIFREFSLENFSNLPLLKIVKINNPNKKDLDPIDVIGAGDYVIKKIGPLEILIESRIKNQPNFLFKVVKDETTLALKLLNNEVDLSVANLSPRKIAWLKEKKNLLNVWDIASGNFQFLGLNFKNDLFKKVQFRKAISHLIPREELLKYKLKGTVQLANGMFSPAFLDMFTNDQVDKYDPVLAKNLLLESGVLTKNDGVLYYNGKPIVIDWKVSNNKASIEIVEIIKHYLEKAGFKVEVSILEWGTFMSSFKSGKYDFIIGQWIGFTGPDMLRFVFHSSNTPPKGGNRIYYNNEKFDKAIDLATVQTDAPKRLSLYKAAYKIINEDHAYINLWHPNIVWIGSKCLKNVKLVSTGSFQFLPKMEYRCD